MILFTIIGAIIGAGFASGQEIYLFFYRFGIDGMFGIILCNILMAYIIYKSLKIIYINNINTYKDFLEIIFKNSFKPLRNIVNIIINIFLCVTFFIMISGFGAYLSQSLNLNQLIGSSILAIVSFIIFLKNIESLTKINSIIIPILIVFIIIIGTKNIFYIKTIEFNNVNIDKSMFWILQAILYASFNIILVEPVLINLKKFLKSNTQIIVISIGVCIIMSILAILEFLLLINVNIDFRKIEMPLVYVINNNFSEYRFMYGIIILIAIFTTAVSVGFGFISNISKSKKSYPQIARFLCISSALISPIGFSKLVENLFPLFGFLGIIQIFFIVKNKN